MRVAVVVTEFPSVSETFVLNQITGLLDAGHEVDILAGRSGPDSVVHSSFANYELHGRVHCSSMPIAPVHRVTRAPGRIFAGLHRHPRATLRALNAVRFGRRAASLRLLYDVAAVPAREYDIILCHFGPNAIRGMYLRETGALAGKLVAVFHGFDLSQYLRKHGEQVYARLLPSADLLIAISNRWHDKLVTLGAPPQKTIVHHMGIETEAFPVSRRLAETSPTRLLTIGRLVEKKGIEYGLRAFAELPRSGEKAAEYTIVGDGPLRSSLEALGRELCIAERIRWLGALPQGGVRAQLANADILLAPSVTSSDGDEEGIPVSIMEAMATGLPVVSTHHSGIPELVEDSVSGYLVPERDHRQLASRVMALVRSPGLRQRMGLAGRQRVEEEFNVERLNRKLVERFRELLEHAS